MEEDPGSGKGVVRGNPVFLTLRIDIWGKPPIIASKVLKLVFSENHSLRKDFN
jgi:hypothetical protein